MDKDYYTLSSSDTCVIINKVFKAPVTPYYRTLLQAHKKGCLKFDVEANMQFYLRFYFPKTQMITPHSRPRKLIIMFNGLNEVFSRYYNLYDRLGNSFASHGISSVLLPTPFHLNRAAVRLDSLNAYPDRGSIPETRDHYKIPADDLVNNPFVLYMNFIQILHEFKLLLSLCRNKFGEVNSCTHADIQELTNEDIAFYTQHFNPEQLSVSLLGYSLGGLKALTCFFDDPNQLDSCMLMNSGAALDSMTLKGIMDDNIWKETVKKLKDQRLSKDNFLFKLKIEDDPYFKTVRDIFFSNDLFRPEIIEKVGRQLILVIGGKDKIIPPDGIKRLEPKGYGLNILQISALGHFLADDVTFNHWYPRVFSLLLEFLNEPQECALSKRESLLTLLAYHGLCDCNLFSIDAGKIPKSRSELYENVRNALAAYCSGDDEKSLYYFDEVLRVAYAYVKDTHDLLNQLKQLRHKKRLIYGKVLLDCNHHLSRKEEDINKALEKKGAEIMSGDHLVSVGIIDNDVHVFTLIEQIDRYSKLLEESCCSYQHLNRLFQMKISMMRQRT